MTEKKKKLLTKHDITGKLGDRTLGEIFYGPPRGAGTPSPVAVGVAYVAGKAGLLDDKPKKVKPKFEKIHGLKLITKKGYTDPPRKPMGNKD